MARIINLTFDELLVKQKIVCNRDFSEVHIWMDEYCALCHSQNKDVTIDVETIKELILAKAETEAEVLSDYLRIALGHLLLTSLSDGFAFSSDYALMKTAFQLFTDRGFNNCSVNNSVPIEYSVFE